MNVRVNLPSRLHCDRSRKRVLCGRVVPLILIGLLTGCAAPPGANAFVNATTELRSSMQTLGQTVESHIRKSEAGVERAAIFADHWQQRDAALDAMCAYAESLNDVVAAGDSGSESARRIGRALSGLAGDLGLDSPPAAAAESVLDLTARISTQITRVAAAQSLTQALEQTHDAVDGITSILISDLDDIDAVLTALHADVQSDILAEFSTERSFRAEIIEERRQIYALGLHGMSDAQTRRLAELDALIEQAHSWHAPMQQRLNDATQTFTLAQELIALARSALHAWQTTHHDLHAAVEQQRPVDHSSLSEIVLRIRRFADEGGRS